MNGSPKNISLHICIADILEATVVAVLAVQVVLSSVRLHPSGVHMHSPPPPTATHDCHVGQLHVCPQPPTRRSNCKHVFGTTSPGKARNKMKPSLTIAVSGYSTFLAQLLFLFAILLLAPFSSAMISPSVVINCSCANSAISSFTTSGVT